eukprot:GHVU01202005.1.p1 GENE.GHVU01202005.1~~GHVU01202005.1.p1  ORF type:complete len:249 (-),score=26.36 GHVU01202005.1:537-1283(-)
MKLQHAKTLLPARPGVGTAVKAIVCSDDCQCVAVAVPQKVYIFDGSHTLINKIAPLGSRGAGDAAAGTEAEDDVVILDVTLSPDAQTVGVSQSDDKFVVHHLRRGGSKSGKDGSKAKRNEPVTVQLGTPITRARWLCEDRVIAAQADGVLLLVRPHRQKQVKTLLQTFSPPNSLLVSRDRTSVLSSHRDGQSYQITFGDQKTTKASRLLRLPPGAQMFDWHPETGVLTCHQQALSFYSNDGKLVRVTG